VSDIRYCIITL